MKSRNYSIIGEENQRARERGLIQAEWYTSPVPRQRLRELMKRKDGPAIRDTLIWFISLGVFGVIAYFTWGTWWAIPAFAVYGAVYYCPAQSRWHECSHGTPFKTTWMNEALYQISSFMSLMPATPWRWSHTRHHTDTIIVGSDPEIHQPRPPVWRILILEMFRLLGGPKTFWIIIKRAMGWLSEEEKTYIPTTAYRKIRWESRSYIILYLGVIGLCVYTGSILPAMFVGLPILYGAPFMVFIGISQHLGLHEDVLDHRLNSRTYYAGPVIRFLYWNMNYHIEHHMFPMVPYHALPALHEEMKPDCPPACPSTWAAFKETMVALWRQRHDPSYTVPRNLPSTAQPFKY
jgi:fatty acid desaturase